MKFTGSSVELVNQSECRVVRNVTYEFLSPGEPYGPHNLFLNASSEDIERATAVSEAALMLSDFVEYARKQSDVMGPGGYRKSGTLAAFESCVIGDRNFNVLREASLLVAVQDIPKPIVGDETSLDIRNCNMIESRIGQARLLGASMMAANLITKDTGLLAARFINLCDGGDPAFRGSASEAARSLLTDVRTEYREAVQGGPLEDRPYHGSMGYPSETIIAYERQNPFIVQLANS